MMRLPHHRKELAEGNFLALPSLIESYGAAVLRLSGADEEPITVDEFFLKATPHFRNLSIYGGVPSAFKGKPVMNFNRLSMLVENDEDFQVLAEVHVFNEYNFETSNRC